MIHEPASSSVRAAWTGSSLGIDHACLGVADSKGADFVWTGGVSSVGWRPRLTCMRARASALLSSYILVGLMIDAVVAEGHLLGDMSVSGV